MFLVRWVEGGAWDPSVIYEYIFTLLSSMANHIFLTMLYGRILLTLQEIESMMNRMMHEYTYHVRMKTELIRGLHPDV